MVCVCSGARWTAAPVYPGAEVSSRPVVVTVDNHSFLITIGSSQGLTWGLKDLVTVDKDLVTVDKDLVTVDNH